MYCLRGIDSLGNLCQQWSDALKTAVSSSFCPTEAEVFFPEIRRYGSGKLVFVSGTDFN
jgi:hypothetical protein